MTILDAVKRKILNEKDVEKLAYRLHFFEKKIVFTNGCFDILHLGHIHLIAAASELGDHLIVGLNSDESIKKLNKGIERPILDQETRAIILASLCFVDNVVIFDEETPYSLIKKIKPHVLVKGSDYAEEEIVGADIVKANGGSIVRIPILKDYSTSEIVKKIIKLSSAGDVHLK